MRHWLDWYWKWCGWIGFRAELTKGDCRQGITLWANSEEGYCAIRAELQADVDRLRENGWEVSRMFTL